MSRLRRGARPAVAVGLGTGLYLAMVGSVDPWAVAQGVLFALAAVAVARPLLADPPERTSWSRRYMARLLARSGWDVVRGSWTVGLAAAGLRPVPRPAWIEVPVGEHPPARPGVVALLETLSPGSYLVEHDEERGSMLFHVFDAADAERLRRSLVYALRDGGTEETSERPGGER